MNFCKAILMSTIAVTVGTASAGAIAARPVVAEQSAEADDSMILMQQSTQTQAQKITDNIYKATGFGNTFLVTTKEGNVVIDTSLTASAAAHKKLLDAISNDVPKYVIITHAHGDHTGGIDLWKGPKTEVIAQEESVEFLHYQKRLTGFFARRNSAQFNIPIDDAAPTAERPGNFDASVQATILFENKHSFDLGDLTFESLSMPSETLDALVVWIPQRKAVFTGDLFYRSFPNIYTLRGTKPRWALDYVAAVDKVLALEPELLIPSHGEPIYGTEAIESALTKYRDAILFVHDAVVEGMNSGKDVYTLMDEIKLPPELELGETYGTVSWSVRGIYEGYAGWFDGNPTTMLNINPNASDSNMIDLAGGPERVLNRASTLASNNDLPAALAMTDRVLSTDPDHQNALRLKILILEKFANGTKNVNALGWLNHGIREARHRLADKPD